MKTGLIVFVPQQKERIDDWAPARVLGLEADEVRLATSEGELAHGWWDLHVRGANRVTYVWALWDGVRGAWSPQCDPRHLCG